MPSPAPPPRPTTDPVLAATQVICAAGGLVWKPTPAGPALAVIRRVRYGPEWTLPKGKLDPGEDWAAAALREVWEETACRARIDSFAGCLCYPHAGQPKVVLFWNMSLEAEHPFAPSDEVLERRWVRLEHAADLLTHPDERALLSRRSVAGGAPRRLTARPRRPARAGRG